MTDLAVTEAERRLPAIDGQAERLGLLILRLASQLSYDVEVTAQRPNGLSSAGFHLCWVLWLLGPVEASVAASFMGESRATVSGVSATLARHGLVLKGTSPADGRSVVLRLSAKGRKCVEETQTAVARRHSELGKALTSNERAELVRLLSKFASGFPQRLRHRK